MPKNYSIAKISAPVIPVGIVQRERLFRLLDENRKRPIVWVSGPGGAGKTTLVTSYLQSRKLPCLWYQVDEGDGNIGSFFYYMGMAVAKSSLSRRKPMPLLSMEYGLGIPTFTRRYFEELYGRLKRSSIVFFDNYQDAPQESAFNDIVSAGLSIIPEGMTVFILSRTDPPSPFARLKAGRMIEPIGWEHTRFTIEETKEMVHTSAKNFSEAEIKDLHRQTEGWAAGLVLMIEKAKVNGAAFPQKAMVPREDIFNYFASELLSKAGPEDRSFLLKTAVLPFITPTMAKKLTGIERPGKILRELTQRHFFITRHAREGTYQYHPLFQEFLLFKSGEVHKPAEFRDLRVRAAGILEENGFAQDAVNLFFKAGEWQAGASLVCREAPHFFAEGRSEIVHTWMESLPGELLEVNPDLLYWKGACLMAFNPGKSRNCFRKAYDLFSLKKDKLGQLLSWSGGADVSLIEMEFTHMDQWLNLLEDLQVEDFAFPSPEIEARIIMSIFNAMSVRHSGHPDIEKWSNRTAALLLGNVNINLRLQAGVYLACHYLWKGSFSRASFVIRQIQDMAMSKDISPLAAIGVKLAEVLQALLTANGEQGVVLVTEAMKISNETGVHVWDSQLLCHGFCCAVSSGDYSTAERLLAEMRSNIEGKSRFEIGYYHALICWQELLRGDFTAAYFHLRITQENFQATGFRAVEVCVLHGLVEIMLAKGEADQARKCVARSYEVARETKSS